MDEFDRLQKQVVEAGLCTHCGTCVGLAEKDLHMVETVHGPVPQLRHGRLPAPHPLLYGTCPGKGVNYPELYQAVFDRLPENWLLGPAEKMYVGYSRQSDIRRQGASGGVITQTLLYLLESGQIDGAVVVKMGLPRPWQAQAIIATTPEEIKACSQSVYAPVPVNAILAEMCKFNGRLAYVGLPDQVAALRMLQQAGHEGANKVSFVLGPYVGTNMYQEAIESFLRANNITDINQVIELRYRAGEWPGYLLVRMQDGRELKAEKFYYNYLIPFYITRSSWLAVDFTNELTDISVGDAWHPQYEALGAGFSVVVARTPKAVKLLNEMADAKLVSLEETTVENALSMHGHMLDFKKRGSFIRLGWRKRLGKKIPQYGYYPVQLPLSRKLVELIISGLFVVCSTRPARWLVEHVPIGLIGPLFNTLRKSWKNLSKPTKRKGLGHIKFMIEPTE